MFCAVSAFLSLIIFCFSSLISDYHVLLDTFAQDDSHSSHAAALEPQLSSEERKMKWEQGQADYMGMDSFDNIKRKLDTFLK